MILNAFLFIILKTFLEILKMVFMVNEDLNWVVKFPTINKI